VLVPDALADPAMAPFVELFKQERIRSLGFFPLMIGGRLLGKFMVYFDTPHVFESHEVELASSIANHLASVITRFNAIRRLEDTIKSNELFAAVLAHDLRNPLGAIMNSAQAVLMRQEGRAAPADVMDSQPLSRILRSGQRMTTMIDQLLDFTRARSGGGIQIEPHAVNLGELCSQAIAELELANPSWTIRCEARGNSSGVWDAARILQVISNLVGNAGHHGIPGTDIHVSIDGLAPHEVRLEIRNDGAIASDVRRNLFEPFLGAHRMDAGSSGLGLGLFIVREIVRAHEGDVTIDSDESQTVARVRLPRVVTKADAVVHPAE
jgi:two-component system, sensor histidine kinase and response regulator